MQTRDRPVGAPVVAAVEDDEFGSLAGGELEAAAGVADGNGGSYTLAGPAIGEPDFEQFLKGLAIASRYTVTLSDFQRKKLKNRAAELHGLDESAGREPQSEFADLLKALVEMMRAPPGSAVKPQTLWK